MPELKASPRNRALGLLADAMDSAKTSMNSVNVPLLGPLGDLVLAKATNEANDWSYGNSPFTMPASGVGGYIPVTKNNRRESLADAVNFLAGLDIAKPAVSAAGRVAARELGPMAAQQAEQFLLKQGAIKPITAFHGTPHKFNKFKLEKIGSGEGAQAYGHGLYFADDPKVAQQYQKDLSKGGDLINGKPITDFYDMISQRADRLPMEKAQVEYEKMNFLEDLMQSGDFNAAVKRVDDEQAAKWAMGLQDKWTPAGNFYKVDIPDEAVANMLLWDKPLSEQPKGVLDALDRGGFSLQPSGREIEKIAEQRIKAEAEDWADMTGGDPYDYSNSVDWEEYVDSIRREFNGLNPSMTGREFHQYLVKESGYNPGLLEGVNEYQDAVRSDLLKMGIPGIRYLDGTSRKSGEGTMNTVVFDDSIIKILERNGVPLGLLAD